MKRNYNLKSESIHLSFLDPIGEVLDFYGVERKNGCWIPTKNVPKSSNEVVRQLMTKLDILPPTRILIGLLKRKSFCHNPLCLNPCHFYIYLKQDKNHNDNNLSDLVDELDLGLYQDLGEELYLNELNRDYPPSMWITKEQLRTAAKLRVLRDRK